MALLVTLTGCVENHINPPRQGSVYEEPPMVVGMDDYIYYPGYEVYYSNIRHQYAFQEGNLWVARSVPSGVTINELRASPSVRMNFHDSPANHHAAMVQQYPENWKPSAQTLTDNQRRENNGR